MAIQQNRGLTRVSPTLENPTPSNGVYKIKISDIIESINGGKKQLESRYSDNLHGREKIKRDKEKLEELGLKAAQEIKIQGMGGEPDQILVIWELIET